MLVSEILRVEVPDVNLDASTESLTAMPPNWVDVEIGLQDMVDAYWQVQGLKEHAVVMPVAVFVPSLGRCSAHCMAILLA